MKTPHGVKSTPRPFWRCFAWRPSRMVKQRDCGSITIYSLTKQGRHYAALSCLSISGTVQMWDLSGAAEDLHLHDWVSSFLCFKGFYCLWDIWNYWPVNTITHQRRRESAVIMLWQTKLWFRSFTENVWLTVHLVFWVADIAVYIYSTINIHI